MSPFIRTLVVAAVAAGVVGIGASASAQGPWEAPAAEKAKKSPGGNAANGKKLAETNGISCLGETPMTRTAAVVASYVARARAADAASVRVVATSAMRDAQNGAAFAARLAAETGAQVEIITGDEEARLTLRGLRRGLSIRAQT